MVSTLEISIPTTTLASSPKPHTLYNLTLRLPLRTFTLQKRYSDFTALHALLTSQADVAPPASLPSKSYFSSTISNPALAESRRAGLETYLRELNSIADPRWRDTLAWRAFLNLPSNLSSKSSAATSLHSTLTSTSTASDAGVTDPVAWLDTHRELKTHLHNARAHIATRDAGPAGSTAGHEEAAQAKKELVRATGLLGALDRGLKAQGKDWGAQKLGEGEVRRRRDLLASARRDMEGLEGLLVLVKRKGEVDGVVDGLGLGHGKDQGAALLGTSTEGKGVGKGRVLGKETARTRELGNRGVAQLQRQMMQEQDEDVDILAQAVRRQKELGIQIQEELELQNDELNLLDEDVDRLGGKVKVARKRVDKIS